MTQSFKLAVAQLDLVVGDVTGNVDKMIAAAADARRQSAAMIVFPELSVCGYPPEDLLLHAGLRADVDLALQRIEREVEGIAIVFGYPEYADGKLYNAALVVANGERIGHYRKRCLPNYAVFDERRYFTPGDAPGLFEFQGARLGLAICEDVWQDEPLLDLHRGGAELAIVINGSPFEVDSQKNREATVAKRLADAPVPVVYVNMVGGQDELVFDGGSFAMSAAGETVSRAPQFEEALYLLDVKTAPAVEISGELCPVDAVEARIYRALVTGTRDYIEKHRFPGVIIGLSGGIDSALVLAIAVDAIGADRVRVVQMPFKYTSSISIKDSAEQAALMGVQFDTISIEPIYDAVVQQLAPIFAGRDEDVTEENIQSRSRGLLLMSISNKTGRMLLTTGNKSEMAVGYATLYGDMAGGFAPIKDCSKTLVYRLARYRNSLGRVIPERVITREPSAELRPDQKDSDSLPDYAVLDPILEAFIEEDLSVNEIEARGFDRQVVIRVLKLVQRNEYKRRQSPPGIRISRRAFGRDWRYPITSWYKFPS